MCICGLVFLSTQNTLNGHGILTGDNLDAQVWAQVGTTGDGGGTSGGESGGTSGGGTPEINIQGKCLEKYTSKFEYDEKTGLPSKEIRTYTCTRLLTPNEQCRQGTMEIKYYDGIPSLYGIGVTDNRVSTKC